MLRGLRVAAWRSGSTRLLGPSASLRGAHFDTLKFVEHLRAQGLTSDQSASVMTALSDVMEESIRNLSRTLVTKEEQEKSTYTQKVDFAHLRSDLQTLEKNDFALTKNEHDRLSGEIEKVRQKLREEVNRALANVRLDLNLEKGRIREESSANELRIKETDTRIEAEISNMKAQLESVKFQVMQWLVGVVTGIGALTLAATRIRAATSYVKLTVVM